jgi:lysophospholipase L1-like esterase
MGAIPTQRAHSRAWRAAALAAPYVLFASALVGAEAATRLALPAIAPLDAFVTSPQQRAQMVDRDHVRIYSWDPLLLWRLQPDLRDQPWDLTLVTTNAQGLRYPAPLGRKMQGTFRMICLGDSVTFGYQVPYFDPRHPRPIDPEHLPYAALVEARLRAANPGRRIEVLPLAVPGYSSHQGLAWLRRDIAWLEPDVVVACFGWNDIGMRNATDAETMAADAVSTTARKIVGGSQALLHARGWLIEHGLGRHDRPAPGWATTPRVPREAYVRNLLAIAALARERGALPVLLGPVYRDRATAPPEGDEIGAYRAALKAAALERGIDYLEIPELTEASAPGNWPLFAEHIHPNHRGHALLAQRLLAFLGERRLLGDLAATGPEATP